LNHPPHNCQHFWKFIYFLSPFMSCFVSRALFLQFPFVQLVHVHFSFSLCKKASNHQFPILLWRITKNHFSQQLYSCGKDQKSLHCLLFPHLCAIGAALSSPISLIVASSGRKKRPIYNEVNQERRNDSARRMHMHPKMPLGAHKVEFSHSALLLLSLSTSIIECPHRPVAALTL
jgi:hypothetical protein